MLPVIEQELPRLFGYSRHRSGIRQVWQVVTADAGFRETFDSGKSAGDASDELLCQRSSLTQRNARKNNARRCIGYARSLQRSNECSVHRPRISCRSDNYSVNQSRDPRTRYLVSGVFFQWHFIDDLQHASNDPNRRCNQVRNGVRLGYKLPATLVLRQSRYA